MRRNTFQGTGTITSGTELKIIPILPEERGRKHLITNIFIFTQCTGYTMYNYTM